MLLLNCIIKIFNIWVPVIDIIFQHFFSFKKKGGGGIVGVPFKLYKLFTESCKTCYYVSRKGKLADLPITRTDGFHLAYIITDISFSLEI